MGRPPDHILVFEPDPRGHAREWVEHLMRGTADRRPPVRLTLVVPASLAEALRPDLPGHVRLDPLSAREQHLCTHRRLAVSGFARWLALCRHLRGTDAAHALYLGLDHLTLPLGLGLSAGGPPVSGILFRPTAHYREIGAPPVRLAERVRDLHKSVLTRLTARNRAVRTIFSLDPCFPAYAHRHYPDAHKFVALGDPVFPVPEPGERDPSIAAGLPCGRRIFVLFGEITERKGIFALLDALSRLSGPAAESLAVVAAGRIDPAIRAEVERACTAARTATPGLLLRVVDRRLSAEELAGLIERCHTVLAPYQRFVGSSGVLLWAACMGRPVIGQDYGLVGHLIRRHALGLAVDTSDPVALAAAIAGAARRDPASLCEEPRMREFLAARSPNAFVDTLLAGMAESAGNPPFGAVTEVPPTAPEWSQRFPV